MKEFVSYLTGGTFQDTLVAIAALCLFLIAMMILSGLMQ